MSKAIARHQISANMSTERNKIVPSNEYVAQNETPENESIVQKQTPTDESVVQKDTSDNQSAAQSPMSGQQSVEQKETNGWSRLNWRFLIGFFLKLDSTKEFGSVTRR
jgi:hypothetical protein